LAHLNSLAWICGSWQSGETDMPRKSDSVPRAARAAPAHQLFKGRLSERHLEIIEAAAALFAERGYQAASMRDIAEQVGLLGGSLYHHIKSKKELFLQVHELALEGAADLVREAAAEHKDPWARLEAACVRLLEIQLDPNSITMPLMNDFRAVPAEIRTHLIARRDEFERIFTELVGALPLDPRLDRGVYRLLLLSLLNSVSTWYRPGRLTPVEISHQIMMIFKHPANTNSHKE